MWRIIDYFFRIYGVSATYVWHDPHINGECSTNALHVHTFAVDYNVCVSYFEAFQVYASIYVIVLLK